MRLHLLGSLRLTIGPDGRDVFSNEKAKYLLAYLTRIRRRNATREELVRLFWPDALEARAYASLRQAIRSVRSVQKKHDCHFLEAEQRSFISIDAAKLDTDVDDIKVAVATGAYSEIERAAGLWQPDIMAAASFSGEDFEAWRVVETAAIRKEVVEAALNRVAGDDLFRTDPSLAIALCNFVLCVEPSHEIAHLRLIEHYIQADDSRSALDQFHSYEEVVQREIGLPPSPAARQLVAPLMIKSAPISEVMRIGRPAIAIEADKTSVRMRKALDLSLEEISHRLADFRHLALIGSPLSSNANAAGADAAGDGNPVFRRKVVAQDLPSADFALNLKPSAGEQHLLIELTNLTTGRMLFHDRIAVSDLEGRVDLDDLYGWRAARIERTIVNDMLEHGGTRDNMVARWAQATNLIKDFNPDSIDRAYTLLNETISAIGPRFAPAHAALASAALTRRLYRPDGDKAAALFEARARIGTALSIDPWDPYTRRIAGWTAFQGQDFESGLDHFAASLDLNSSDPYTIIAAAEAFAYAGEIEKARECAERGVRLLRPAPPYFFSYLATIFFAASDYTSCIAYCDKGPDQSAEVLVLKAAALGRLGRTKQSASLIDGLRKDSRHSSDEAISDWLAETNMFRRTETRDAFVRGLEAAGLGAIRQKFEQRQANLGKLRAR